MSERTKWKSQLCHLLDTLNQVVYLHFLLRKMDVMRPILQSCYEIHTRNNIYKVHVNTQHIGSTQSVVARFT